MSTDVPRRPVAGPGVRLSVTPADAGWKYLSFSVVAVEAGAPFEAEFDDQELAVVPLRGGGTVVAGVERFDVSRPDVFVAMPNVVYAPPGTPVRVETTDSFEFALGSAPAEGRYPVRCFTPAEMQSEVRGGGAARRQVNHVLAPPLPAERLICYEVYVPRGTWSGWPPHCHDGWDDSPYLEETYYFRTDPADGFALHRNWRVDEDFDQSFVAADGDVVLVPKGYHTSAAAPGSHVFFLNYLAGELVDGERVTPPCLHPSYTWIEEDWDRDGWRLPVVTA